MTREKAIDSIFRKAPGMPSAEQAGNWADLFAELGMLKLDEPKDEALEFARRVCAKIPEGYVGPNPRGLMMALEAAGLRIVEK